MQELAGRVIALMPERGYEYVYDSWPSEKIATALAWSF